MAYSRTIALKDFTDIREEALANEANIKPGHILEMLSTGKVQLNDRANGRVVARVAVEDSMQGVEVGTAYTSGALVQYGIFRAGDVVKLRLKDGETAVVGSVLIAATGGEVEVADSADGTDFIFAEALEAVDMSGSAGADPSPLITAVIA